MTVSNEWSDAHILRVLDLGDEREWVAVFGRVLREGLPGSPLFMEPGRVEYWMQAILDRITRSDEAGRRTRVLLTSIPASPPFVHRFLRKPSIPEAEKLRFIHAFVKSKRDSRQALFFESARRVFIETLLLEQAPGHSGWEPCNIKDVQRLLRLLADIVPPLNFSRRFGNGERRNLNRQRKHQSGRASRLRLPVRSPVAKFPVHARRARPRGVQAWQALPFLKFADPDTQELAFSWVADFPELLCCLAGYDLSLSWQKRIQETLDGLVRTTRRGEVIASLRRHKERLRDQIGIWADQTIRRVHEDMKRRHVPSSSGGDAD